MLLDMETTPQDDEHDQAVMLKTAEDEDGGSSAAKSNGATSTTKAAPARIRKKIPSRGSVGRTRSAPLHKIVPGAPQFPENAPRAKMPPRNKSTEGMAPPSFPDNKPRPRRRPPTRTKTYDERTGEPTTSTRKTPSRSQSMGKAAIEKRMEGDTGSNHDKDLEKKARPRKAKSTSSDKTSSRSKSPKKPVQARSKSPIPNSTTLTRSSHSPRPKQEKGGELSARVGDSAMDRSANGSRRRNRTTSSHSPPKNSPTRAQQALQRPVRSNRSKLEDPSEASEQPPSDSEGNTPQQTPRKPVRRTRSKLDDHFKSCRQSPSSSSEQGPLRPVRRSRSKREDPSESAEHCPSKSEENPQQQAPRKPVRRSRSKLEDPFESTTEQPPPESEENALNFAQFDEHQNSVNFAAQFDPSVDGNNHHEDRDSDTSQEEEKDDLAFSANFSANFNYSSSNNNDYNQHPSRPTLDAMLEQKTPEKTEQASVASDSLDDQSVGVMSTMLQFDPTAMAVPGNEAGVVKFKKSKDLTAGGSVFRMEKLAEEQSNIGGAEADENDEDHSERKRSPKSKSPRKAAATRVQKLKKTHSKEPDDKGMGSSRHKEDGDSDAENEANPYLPTQISNNKATGGKSRSKGKKSPPRRTFSFDGRGKRGTDAHMLFEDDSSDSEVEVDESEGGSETYDGGDGGDDDKRKKWKLSSRKTKSAMNFVKNSVGRRSFLPKDEFSSNSKGGVLRSSSFHSKDRGSSATDLSNSSPADSAHSRSGKKGIKGAVKGLLGLSKDDHRQMLCDDDYDSENDFTFGGGDGGD